MLKEIGKKGKKWHREGWISLSIRDFGLGVHTYWWRRQIGIGGSITVDLPFFQFHLEVWRWF